MKITTEKDLPKVAQGMLYVDPGSNRRGVVRLALRWATARIVIDMDPQDAQALGWTLYCGGIGQQAAGGVTP